MRDIFGRLQESKNDPTELIDRYFARMLQKAVSLKGRVSRSWNCLNWACSFRLLREDLDDDVDRIDDVLEWYCPRIRDPYVPLALSAKAFREKFLRIEAAMERYHKNHPNVTITAEAEKVLSFIRHLGWPANTMEQLPISVQVSLNNYNRFRELLQSANDVQHPLWLSAFHRECVTRKFINNVDYITLWMSAVHNSIKGWAAWNGDLRPFQFSTECKRFTEVGEKMSKEWFGTPRKWHEYMDWLQEKN